jgi:hypothetical protein
MASPSATARVEHGSTPKVSQVDFSDGLRPAEEDTRRALVRELQGRDGEAGTASNGAPTKKEAQRIANSWEAQAERKRNALSAAEASRTVGQLAEWWLTTYVSKNAAVYKTSAMVRRHVISSSLGRASLRDVTSASRSSFWGKHPMSARPP